MWPRCLSRAPLLLQGLGEAQQLLPTLTTGMGMAIAHRDYLGLPQQCFRALGSCCSQKAMNSHGQNPPGLREVRLGNSLISSPQNTKMRPLILTMGSLPCSQHLNSLVLKKTTLSGQNQGLCRCPSAARGHFPVMASPLHPKKVCNRGRNLVRYDTCACGITQRGSRCVSRECFPLCSALTELPELLRWQWQGKNSGFSGVCRSTSPHQLAQL